MNKAIPLLCLIATLFAIATAYAQNIPPITIPDYPRHGTQLNPLQREEVRRVAMGVSHTLLIGAEVNVSVLGRGLRRQRSGL